MAFLQITKGYQVKKWEQIVAPGRSNTMCICLETTESTKLLRGCKAGEKVVSMLPQREKHIYALFNWIIENKAFCLVMKMSLSSFKHHLDGLASLKELLNHFLWKFLWTYKMCIVRHVANVSKLSLKSFFF